MITLFISDKCSDSKKAIEAFKNSNLNYETINITENMDNLRFFLHFRDNSKFFKSTKRQNKVGIPTIMINNGEHFIEFNDSINLDNLEKFNK